VTLRNCPAGNQPSSKLLKSVSWLHSSKAREGLTWSDHPEALSGGRSRSTPPRGDLEPKRALRRVLGEPAEGQQRAGKNFLETVRALRSRQKTPVASAGTQLSGPARGLGLGLHREGMQTSTDVTPEIQDILSSGMPSSYAAVSRDAASDGTTSSKRLP
jgi:hypothetical protein